MKNFAEITASNSRYRRSQNGDEKETESELESMRAKTIYAESAQIQPLFFKKKSMDMLHADDIYGDSTMLDAMKHLHNKKNKKTSPNRKPGTSPTSNRVPPNILNKKRDKSKENNIKKSKPGLKQSETTAKAKNEL